MKTSSIRSSFFSHWRAKLMFLIIILTFIYKLAQSLVFAFFFLFSIRCNFASSARGSEMETRQEENRQARRRCCRLCLFFPSDFEDPVVHASTGQSADNKHLWCWLLLGSKVSTKPLWSGCWGTHSSRPLQIPHDLISALWFSALVYCIGTTFILNCNQLAQKNRAQ